MKFYDPLKHADEVLRSGGLNLREKLNVYAGMIGGMLVPVVASRYAAFPLAEHSGVEAFKWFLFLSPLFFSPLGLIAGAALGTSSAKTLKEIREEREKDRNTLVKKTLFR